MTKKFLRIELRKSMKNSKGYWRVIYSCNGLDTHPINLQCSRVYYGIPADIEYIDSRNDVTREYANDMFLCDRKNGYKIHSYKAV